MHRSHRYFVNAFPIKNFFIVSGLPMILVKTGHAIPKIKITMWFRPSGAWL